MRFELCVPVPFQLDGVVVIEVVQTDDLVPADAKLYALRDVTGTVDSLPLIVSSIMSKKFASGVRSLVLDVKTGNGAFMQRREDALALAQAMVEVGRDLGMKVSALITDMNQPLGRMVGNSLEMIETVQTLQGRGPADLTELTLVFAQEMGRLEGMGDIRPALEAALRDGSAYAKFVEMIEAQGAEPDALERLDAEQADVPRSSNHVGFRNPEADAIIDELEVTFDHERRVELGHLFHRVLHEEAPYTFFSTRMRPAFWRPELRNVRFSMVRPYRNHRAWFFDAGGG